MRDAICISIAFNIREDDNIHESILLGFLEAAMVPLS